MKKVMLFFSFFLMTTLIATETNLSSPWSRYIENPTDENAKKVQNLNNGDSDKGLLILREQIKKGSRESLKLLIRLELSNSVGLDGEVAETIPELISLGAKLNTKDYIEILEEIGWKTCLYIEPREVEKYVDGRNQDLMLANYKDRYEKFSHLKKSPLQQKCTEELKNSMLTLEKKLTYLYVGILDEPQCQINATLEIKNLFQKQGDIFKEFNEIFKPSIYHIAFDGRYFGTTKEKLLKIKNKSHTFSGWCDTPKYRPIVLVSKKNFKDPEKWKPFKPKKEILKKVFPLLKKLVPTLNSIDFDNNKSRVSHYTINDVFLQKSYRNNKHESLVQLDFSFNKKYETSEGKSSTWLKNYWFYLKDEQVKFLDTNLELVDAGDYDSNGQSEVLFWKSDYNKDGYKLYYNQFNNSVLNSWNYN